MALRDEVRVVVHQGEIDAILSGPEAQQLADSVAGEVADIAQGYAPRQLHSHGGAASIQGGAFIQDGAYAAAVGWDREHYYMFFPERGTRYQPARPFMELAVDRYSTMHG